MEKLGYHINVAPLSSSFAENVIQEVPRIEHSIFGEIQNVDSMEEDMRVTDARMQQNFTPEPSLCSQLSTNLAEERMQAVFTPEPSQEFMNYKNRNYPNLDFYQNYQETNDGDYGSGDLFGNCQNENIQNNSLQNYENDDDNYKNISRFIAENSENIQKLIPEVNLSYGEIPEPQNILQKAETYSKFENPKRSSSLEVSDEIQFSLPLQSNATKTSTPVITTTPQVIRSASPLVHIYGSDRRNFSTSTTTNDKSQNSHNNPYILDQIELEGFDVESIREDLEVCSQIFGEDDFEEECLDTTYKSITSNYIQTEEKNLQGPPREKFEHVIPIVTVIKGLNNTTLSFDEDDFKDVQEDNSLVKEGKASTARINIISDIVVAPGKMMQPIKNDEIVTKQDSSQAYIVYQSAHNTGGSDCFNIPSNGGDDQTISSMNEERNFEEINAGKERNHVRRFYKCFDSTFEAARTNTDQSYQSQCSFKSLPEENNVILHSYHSNFGTEPNRQPLDTEKSNGYEISTTGDPRNFITSSSADKTTNKENSIENLEGGDKIVNHQEQSSPNKTEMTSISYASKVRKLDRSSSESSPQEKSGVRKTSSEKTITSVSSASKKRNLDQQVTTDSTSPNGKSDGKTRESDKLESSSSLKESDESGRTESKIPKRKSSTLRRTNSQNESEGTAEKKAKKRAINRKKFVPPRKLTAREIREEFREQDRKILESSPNSSNFSQYLKQLIRRPTVKQVQNTTHLATIRKTGEGVEVIPTKPRMMKTKTEPWKKRHSSENFDVSIFSDKNALPFESYLNSNEKDYKTFSFNFSKNQEAEQKFQFAPTTLSFGEYTNNSITERFVRNVSEMASSQRANTTRAEEVQNVTFCVSQQSVDRTLTPEGFYRQNRDDIQRIVGKYLQSDNQGRSGNRSRNIFDNDDVDFSDLNI